MPNYRRRLPHWYPEGAYLFVTWRLHGSHPAPPPEVIHATPGQTFVRNDRALAQAKGPVWLSDPRVASTVEQAIREGESRDLYELHAWVVMPNHIHLLILPRVPLPRITHWIKGKTSRDANVILGRTGQPFWQDESYDHWVRDERQFHRVVAYIEENPVSAGFVAAPDQWQWSSMWGML